MSSYTPEMTDEMLAAAYEIKLSANKLRSFYPKGNKNVDPMEKFWDYVASEMKINLSGVRVDDFIVTETTNKKLEHMVGQYALNKITYLRKGTNSFQTAVKMHMLDVGPVVLRNDKMKDNVIYYLDHNVRHRMRDKTSRSKQ